MVTEIKPMELKKSQQITAAAPKSKDIPVSGMKPLEFIGEIKDEFQKISWTSAEELKMYTQIVVGATFFFGMGIYLLDLTIQGVLNSLAVVIRLIGG